MYAFIMYVLYILYVLRMYVLCIYMYVLFMYVCVRMDVYVCIYVSRNVVGMCIRDIGLCVCVCVCV
jgi:hypothetical protein